MGNFILDEVREAFRRVAPPEQFHDPCHCEECAEHETTLQAHTPETIGVEQLGNPGWDPICGISEEGYHYYLPGLARLALNEPDYLDQFLFHLSPDRISRFTPDQRVAILHLLEGIRRRLVDVLGDQAEVDVLERRLRRLRA